MAFGPRRACLVEHLVDIQNALVEVQVRHIKGEAVTLAVPAEGQDPGCEGMSDAFGGLGLTFYTELLARSPSQDSAHHVLAVFRADGELLKRPDERPEFRPGLGMAKKAAQAVFVNRKDILADIGREVVVADKLRHALEHLADGRDESATQVVDDGEWDAPGSAHIL